MVRGRAASAHRQGARAARPQACACAVQVRRSGESRRRAGLYADVTYPDDAELIRAHDLGDARNVELFNYYAKRRPDLSVYRYDRGDDSIRYLGSIHELTIHQL